MATARRPLAVREAIRQFGGLEDPRIERTRRHELLDIIVVSLCAIIAGADGWEAIATFAASKQEWLRGFLELPNGAPSADTFRRVLCSLNPERFAACFRDWVAAIAKDFKGEVVAVDGKALRGAIAREGTTTPFHLLQVWATEQRLVLAQRAVNGAPGEIGAIPQLLRLLELDGAIVTVDANGCTASTAAAARDAGADYLLAIKGNRGHLFAHVEDTFEKALRNKRKSISCAISLDEGHGRVEKRTVHAIPATDWPAQDWRDVVSFVRIERERTVGEETSIEVGFYLSSLKPNAKAIAPKIRAHWGIENHLNWTLDVAFREDNQRVRDHVGAGNLAVLNRLALMLLKNETTAKYGAPTKRKRAGWDNDYLALVLTRGLGDPQ
jgi:predicted transposase YbfD/YdcC